MLCTSRTLRGKGKWPIISRQQDAAAFYDEHIFGASTSIRDPSVESTLVQWGQKGSYVWEAVKQAGMLREEAIGVLQPMIPRSNEPTLAVFNTLNWPRSGLTVAYIDHDFIGKIAKGQFVDTQTGQEVAAQPIYDRYEGGYWAVWAKDVPPLGCRTYRIRKGEGQRASVPASGPAPGAIENAWYRLTLDEKTGAVVSLFDKELHRELIDKDCPWRLGQFIYERLQRNDREFQREAFRRTSVRNVSFKPGSIGPIWHSPGVILHWREVEGQPAVLDLGNQPFAGRVKSADEVNVLEEPLQAGIKTVAFKPYEVKFVRLNVATDASRVGE